MGNGRWEILDTGADCVFAIAFDTARNGKIAILNNLAPGRRTVHLDPTRFDLDQAIDLYCDHRYPPLAEAKGKIVMPAYGYRWIRFPGSAQNQSVPDPHSPH